MIGGEYEAVDQAIKRRRDDALRRALNTPPQPKHSQKLKAANSSSGTNEGKPARADVAS